MKQEVLKSKTGTISFTPYLDNQPGVASSATIVLKRSDGTTLQASVSATVDSTTGLISYGLSAALNADLGENYIADFTYVISSVTYYQTILYDVVLNKLAITVIDSDLTTEQAEILKQNENFSGTVDSATSTTVVDDDLKNYADDYWNGGIIEVFLSGAKQTRNITNFVQSTGTITAGVAFSTTPTSSYKYIVRRGFKVKIERAFDYIMYEIRQKGFRPALILESSDLFLPHLNKTLELICRDYSKESEDKWEILSNMYQERYVDLMSKLTVQYDRDEDGAISGSEKAVDTGQNRLVR